MLDPEYLNMDAPREETDEDSDDRSESESASEGGDGK